MKRKFIRLCKQCVDRRKFVKVCKQRAYEMKVFFLQYAYRRKFVKVCKQSAYEMKEYFSSVLIDESLLRYVSTVIKVC